MNSKNRRILFIEDDEIDQKAFKRLAKKENLPYEYIIVGTVSEAKLILENQKFDAVLMDYRLKDGTAFDLLDKVKKVPFIIVTGVGDEEIAVHAMKSGAYDYLIKDIDGNYLKTLPITVENAIKLRNAESELVTYQEKLEELVIERTAKLQTEITERKQAEEALRESEKKWRLLYENLPGGSFVVNNKYIIEDVNNVLCSLTGFTKEELINQPCKVICPQGPYKCPIYDSVGDRINNYEISLKTKDGQLVPIVKSARKILLGDKELIVENFQEITERRQAEEKIRKFKTISDNANYGVAITDLTGNIIYINEYFANVHGYKPINLINKNLAVFHTEEQLEGMKKINNKLQKWGSFSATEVWHVHKDDSVFPMLMNGMVIKDEKAVPLFIAVTAIDITVHKKAEEELRIAKEAADAANKAKSTFLINISHDLRTPMNTILGISKMLGKNDTENLTNKQKDGLQQIYESGNRLLALINDILDLSKIETGRMEVHLKPFSLTELMLDLEEYVKKLIGDKKINFTIQNIFLVPDGILSDAQKLQQILINILGNAVKFTEEGEIICRIYINQDRLYFEVKDTGIRINPKDINCIFNEFRQIGSLPSEKYTGTDFGLALYKKIVKLLGGEMEVESKLNHEIIVRFYIPLITYDGKNTGESVPKKLHEEISKTFTKSSVRKEKIALAEDEFLNGLGLISDNQEYLPKILIAEDEKIGRTTIRMMLEHKYQLIFAGNGKEAVEKYFSENPDIVLMDIMMPEMNGYEAFDEIIKKKRSNYVKIIAITARAMKNERKKILEYGFDDYISKPIDDEILIEKLENYLKKNVSERR